MAPTRPFCAVVNSQYIDKDIYGNGYVLSQPCKSISEVEQFNTYCQTPTTSTAYDQACLDLFSNKVVEEDDELIYNQFIQKPPAEWPENKIPSGGNIVGSIGAFQGSYVQVRSGGSTMAYLALISNVKPPEAEMYYATFQNPEFQKLPEAMVGSTSIRVSDNTIGFDVDLNGVIYFHKTFDIGGGIFTVYIYKFDPATDTEPKFLLELPTTIDFQGPLSVSASGTFLALRIGQNGVNNIVLVNLSSLVWFAPLQDVPVNGSITFTGLCVNDNEDIFYAAVGAPGLNVQSFWWHKFAIRQRYIKSIVLTNRMTNDGTVFGFPGPESKNGGGIIEKITLDDISEIQVFNGGVYAISLAVDINNNRLFIMTTNTSQIIAYPGFLLGSKTQDLVNFAQNQNLQFLDVSWTGSGELFYSANRNNINAFRLFDLEQEYRLVNTWTSLGKQLNLCNNGDIILVDNDTIIGRTATSDGTVETSTEFARGDCDVRLSDQPVLSTNGLYQAKLNPVELKQNLANEDNLAEFCRSQPKRAQLCFQSYKSYCQNNTIDPRCFCFDNQEGILASLFNIDELKRNPVLYGQLFAIAPCISPVCTPFFGESGFIGDYLSTFQCSGDITICTSVLSLESGGAIRGDVFVAQDCGAGSNISCTGGCPIGTKCDLNKNICRTVCTEQSECGFAEVCDISQGLCFQVSETEVKDTKLSTLEIILIVVLSAVVLILFIWIGVKYGRRK